MSHAPPQHNRRGVITDFQQTQGPKGNQGHGFLKADGQRIFFRLASVEEGSPEVGAQVICDYVLSTHPSHAGKIEAVKIRVKSVVRGTVRDARGADFCVSGCAARQESG